MCTSSPFLRLPTRLTLLAAAALSWGCGSDDPPIQPDPGPAPVCAAGDLLVSSRFSDNVLRFNVETGAFLTVFADGGGMDNPNGIAFDVNGDLLVALGDVGSILRYDGSTGAFESEFVAAGSGGLSGPRGMIVLPNGNVIVASGTSDMVLEFNGADGSFSRVAAVHPDLDGPVGVAADATTLHVSSGIDGSIFQFDLESGEFLQRIAMNFPNVTGLLVDLDGSLVAASATMNVVRRYDPTTGEFLGDVATGGRVRIPIGIAWSAERDLIVSSFDTDAVKLFDPSTAGFIRDVVVSGAGGLDGTHFFALVPPEVTLPNGNCS